MYVIKTYPTEHKWKPDAEVRLLWREVRPNSWKLVKDLVQVFKAHRDELGVYISDADIQRTVDTQGILGMNAWMELGTVEVLQENEWLGCS